MKLKQAAVFVAATAGLVLAGAGSANAAAPNSDISVRASNVVLTPAPGGGYSGIQTIQVHYEGPDDAFFIVWVDQPDGLYLELDGPDEDMGGCVYTAPNQGAQSCPLFTELTPGQTQTLHLTYTALAAPEVKTRLTRPGSIAIKGSIDGTPLVDATPANNTGSFGASLRGTGAGIAQRVYRPADHPDMALTTGASQLSFVPQANGTYRAVVPATIAAKTDAYHDYFTIEVNPVPGLDDLYVDPSHPCFSTPAGGWRCGVGVPKIAKNDSVTIGLGIATTAVPPAGTVVEFKLQVSQSGDYDNDVNPADNILRLVVA